MCTNSYSNNSITFSNYFLMRKLFAYYNKISNKLLGKHIEGNDSFEYTLIEFMKNILMILVFIGFLYLYYNI